MNHTKKKKKSNLLAVWYGLRIDCFDRIFQERKMSQWSRFLMSFVKMNRKVIQNNPKFLPIPSLLRLINIICNLRLVFELSHQISRHDILIWELYELIYFSDCLTCDMLRWSSNERVQYRNQHTCVVVFCLTFDSDNCERSSSPGLILFKWSKIFHHFRWTMVVSKTYKSEMVDQLQSNKMDRKLVLIDWKQVRYRKPILIFDFE